MGRRVFLGDVFAGIGAAVPRISSLVSHTLVTSENIGKASTRKVHLNTIQKNTYWGCEPTDGKWVVLR